MCRMIKIIVTEEGVPMVWNSEDWITLRKEHRIVGSLCGTLADLPDQEKFHGLPFILLPDEATLLREKRIARFVRYPSLARAPGKAIKEQYEKYMRRMCDEQAQRGETANSGKVQITEIAEKNLEKPLISKVTRRCRKRRKIDSDLENTTHSDAQSLLLDKMEGNELMTGATSLIVQTFTTYPWLRKEDACSVKWKYPSTVAETLRFKVFRDFWEKGYYVSSAHKFGGDFLIYPGDPYAYKAHFVVICIERNAAIRPADVAVMCRLGDALNKSIILACETNNNEITYQTLKCSILSK